MNRFTPLQLLAFIGVTFLLCASSCSDEENRTEPTLNGSFALFVEGATTAEPTTTSSAPVERGLSTALGVPAGTRLAAVATVTFNGDGSCTSSDQIALAAMLLPSRNVFRTTAAGGDCSFQVNEDGTGTFDVTFAAGGGLPRSTTNVSFVPRADGSLRFIASNSTLGIFGGGSLMPIDTNIPPLSGKFALRVEGETTGSMLAADGTPIAAIATVTFNGNGTCDSVDQIVLPDMFIPARDEFRVASNCVYEELANGFGTFDVTFPGAPATNATFVRDSNDRMYLIAANGGLGLIGAGPLQRVDGNGGPNGNYALDVRGFRPNESGINPLFAIGNVVFNPADGSCTSIDQLVIGNMFLPALGAIRDSTGSGGSCTFTRNGDFAMFDVTFPAGGGLPAAPTQATIVRVSASQWELVAVNTNLDLYGNGSLRLRGDTLAPLTGQRTALISGVETDGDQLAAIATFDFRADGTCTATDRVVINGQRLPADGSFRTTAAAGGSCTFSEDANGLGTMAITFPAGSGLPLSTTNTGFVRSGDDPLTLIANNQTLSFFGIGQLDRR